MKQIFKNYLATFIKNWIQTIGTVLFILMMAAIVIGFLAAPLQIYSHIQGMNNKNNHFTQITTDKNFKYNSRFLYKTVYQNEDYYAAKDPQSDKDDLSLKLFPKYDDGGYLSPIFKEAVKQSVAETKFNSSKDMYDAYANYIRNGINSFTSGALIKLDSSFNMTRYKEPSDTDKMYISDINALIGSDSIANALGAKDASAISRVAAKVNAIFSANAMSYTIQDLQTYVSGNSVYNPAMDPDGVWKYDGNSADAGTAIVQLMKATLWKQEFAARGGNTAYLPKVVNDQLVWPNEDAKAAVQKIIDDMNNADPNKNDHDQKVFGQKKINLISAQVYNDEPFSNRTTFYNLITDIADQKYSKDENWGQQLHYSGDFLNYVTNTTNNYALNYLNYKHDGQNSFNASFEKSMYLSKKESSSLFPTLGIDLYTVNKKDDTNQLQLSEGNRPEELKWTSLEERNNLIKNIINGTIIPEIVINSAFASNNNLHVGDLITLPDGAEHNNVSTLVDPNGLGFGDNTLTDKIQYRISGIGEKFDNSTPGRNYTPFMQDIKTYANGYIDDGMFNLIREAKWANGSVLNNSYTSNIRFTNAKETKLNPVYMYAPHKDNGSFNDGLFDSTYTAFINYKDTSTMSALNNLKIRVIIFIILGVAVLILAFIFINFIITKELNETRRQIGIFKSFGYDIAELSWIFAVKTFLTIFVGMILGYIVSIPLQLYSAGNYLSQVMFKFDKIFYAGGFLPIIFLVIPAIFLLLSYVMTLFYLAEPTLSLLSNGSKVKKGKIHTGPIIKHLSKTGKGFGYRLQQAFVKNSKGKFIVVQVLFAVASLVFTLMFGAQTLMYSVANQGFSVLNSKADHRYSWANQDQINIGYGANQYSFSTDEKEFEKRSFEYKAYSGNEKIGDVLNNDSTMSDSRYRENFLISSISNTFDIDKDMSWEMLMPIDYYLMTNTNGAVNKDNLVSTVQGLIDNGTLKGDKDFYLNAAKADKDIPQPMLSQEMAYHNYYLNWILSFRIGVMNNESKDGIPGVDEIKKDLIAGNNSKFNIKELINYVNKFDAANPDKPIKIDMGQIVTKPDDVRKQFADTLFGLSDKTNDKKNNLFLADITKIITLEMAEGYAEKNYNAALGDPKTATPDKVVKSLIKTKQDAVMKDFTPNNKKYWGMMNNPLINLDSMSSGSSSDSKKDGSSDGLSLSKMNDQTISLIMAAAMLGYNSPNIQDMPVATINEAFFNKDTEALFYNIAVNGVDDSQNGRNSITLFKYDGSYGKYDSSLTHDGVSDATMKSLADDSPVKDSINVVVPYGLAKYRDLHVGDIFTVYSKTKQTQPIKLHIIGINKSVAMSLGGGWSIDADYDQFTKHYFSKELQDEVAKHPMFNAWISNEPMLQGDINLNDIPGSVDTMKYVGKNLSISIAPGASIFGSIFNGMVDFSTLLGSQIDPTYRLITNPNVASTSNLSSVLPFNILRAGVDQGIDEVNNILVLFMCLVAILLLIILVLVMNIIVEQATPIILTLKSLGYRQLEINWITMGSYIMGAVVSFLIAYGLSLLVWNVFLIVAGNLWHIYVFMAYSWKAPVITFLVISVILFIGWFVSDRKVERIPLTLVTGFN